MISSICSPTSKQASKQADLSTCSEVSHQVLLLDLIYFAIASHILICKTGHVNKLTTITGFFKKRNLGMFDFAKAAFIVACLNTDALSRTYCMVCIATLVSVCVQWRTERKQLMWYMCNYAFKMGRMFSSYNSQVKG